MGIQGHSKDDVDVVFRDLDALDQETDQIAPRRPIHVIQPAADRLGESLELADDHRQGRPQIGRVDRGFPLLLQGTDPLPEARHARFEVLLLDDAVRVAVDQASHAAAQGGQPAVDGG